MEARTNNALFTDEEHPLKAATPEEQAQVVERIKEAKKGVDNPVPSEMRGADTGLEIVATFTNEDGGTETCRDTYYGDGIEPAPLGERAVVTNADIARRLEVSQPTASGYINHPEKMNTEQVNKLCDLLGVRLDELRHGIDWSAREPERRMGAMYGADTVAEVYDMLDGENKLFIERAFRACFTSDADYALAFNRARNRAKSAGRARL